MAATRWRPQGSRRDRDDRGREGMTAVPVGTGRRKVKAGAISAGHAMAVAGARDKRGHSRDGKFKRPQAPQLELG